MDSPDLEYEFPCYNGMEAPEGIWSPKKFGEDAIYGGVLLKSTALNSNQSKDTILKMMLPRIQAHTRRYVFIIFRNLKKNSWLIYQFFVMILYYSRLIEE